MNDDVRAVLTQLVQAEGERFYGDAGRVESRLQELTRERGTEIAALVTAVDAGAVGELLGVKPGLFDISVGHLTARMLRLHDMDPEAGRWAVESWAEALGTAPSPSRAELAPPLPPAPPPPPPPPEPARAPGTRRVGWPWLAGVGAAAVLLVVLVAVVASRDGGGPATNQRAAATSTLGTSVPAPQSPGLTIPPGLTLGTGDVQVTVIWADGNDLDLHVVDPAGAEIYFSNPHSPSGGTLDHDDTAGCASSGTHVENVFWPSGTAPPGRYRVFVKSYSACGAPSQYTLRVMVGGRVILATTGSIPATEGAESPPSEFTR
jgi:hypothetical protein